MHVETAGLENARSLCRSDSTTIATKDLTTAHDRESEDLKVGLAASTQSLEDESEYSQALTAKNYKLRRTIGKHKAKVQLEDCEE